jgi:subtilisin family serine protease
VYPWTSPADLGGGIADLDVVPDSVGRLLVTAVRTDGTLVVRSQSSPEGTWSSWQTIGTGMRSVTAAQHANGRLELFAIGRDGALYTRLQGSSGSGWSSWVKTAGSFKEVEAYSLADGRLELALLGTTNTLSLRTQRGPNGSWNAITRVAGSYQKIKAGLSANGDGLMVALTTSNQLLQRTLGTSGRWGSWSTTRTSVIDFDLARQSSGRLEVFAVTQSGALMHRAQTSSPNSWSSWTSLAFGIRQVEALLASDGKTQIVALNSAGKAMARTRLTPSSAWSRWEDLGATQRLLQLASHPSGRVESFTVGANGRLLQRSQQSSSIAPDRPAWSLSAMRVVDVWNRGYVGNGIVVAVLDTGIDPRHPDLKGNIWTNSDEIPGNGIDDDNNGFIDDRNGWDFVRQDNSPLDANGHGTHVAGIIAALRNGVGMTGVAPGVQIMPVQVLDADGKGSSFDIDRGIRYAVDNGAKIVNISIGGNFNNAAVTEAIRYARSKGVLIVAGAGNDASSNPTYPAAYSAQFDNVLSVGSHNASSVQSLATNNVGSSRAVQVDAPGEQIYSTIPDGGYRTMSGTSMASPHVAALAALVLSANPNLSPAQLRQIMVDSADRRITDSDTQGGVDAVAAIDLALSRPFLAS